MTEDKGYSRETKERLTNAVEQEINEVGKLVKHLCKSSGTSEVLMRCAREFAGNDMGLQDTHESGHCIQKRTRSFEHYPEHTVINVKRSPGRPSNHHYHLHVCCQYPSGMFI
ncbi:uncharacterized protein LOC135805785 isoform X1 [Sycon ciliatum]|uniref:uncharacterized protein LOC135805785 isoform X1 n=1 Tax=Sycon ciliatum TaxID=27933 RepID=UPI0031F65592